jgi:methylmalonyl-CoA/ethylmalonyl-CoA epimerase
MFTALSCVTVAVFDMDAAVATYRDCLGLELIGNERTSPRGFGLRWQELGWEGMPFLELVTPIADSGPVARSLERRGEGVYQVRLVTDDINRTLDHVENRGGRVVRDDHWHPGLRKLGWVHPNTTHGVLFEIVEEA